MKQTGSGSLASPVPLVQVTVSSLEGTERVGISVQASGPARVAGPGVRGSELSSGRAEPSVKQ